MTQTASATPSVRPAAAATPSTPRLLKSANGWWFLGERKLLLLADHAVGEDGRLHPDIARRLHELGTHGDTPLAAYSLTVFTSTSCNLGCGYCFQNVGIDPRGGTRPPRIDNYSLRRSTARHIIDFAAGQMEKAGLTRLDVLLFGGEPLLNPAGCREILRLAGEHGLRSAQMTSNGTLLTTELALDLDGLGLGRIQISFDGCRDDHDQIRIRRSGGPTFDTILTNMARATEVTGFRWDLRVNVSHHNRARLGELAGQVAEQVDPARCRIYFTLVNDVGIGYENTLVRDPELVDSFVRWTIDAVERGFGIPKPAPIRPCLSCSFHDGQFGAVVNADGTLYSCWESTGKPGWEVGTVRDGYLSRVDNRWVACGYATRNKDRDDARAAFNDAVDAQVLDFLHATGRLGLVNGRHDPAE